MPTPPDSRLLLPDKPIEVKVLPPPEGEPRVEHLLKTIWKDRWARIVLLVVLAAGIIVLGLDQLFNVQTVIGGKTGQGIPYLVRMPRCFAASSPQSVTLEVYPPETMTLSSKSIPNGPSISPSLLFNTSAVTTTLRIASSFDPNFSVSNSAPSKVSFNVQGLTQVVHSTSVSLEKAQLFEPIDLDIKIQVSDPISETFPLKINPCYLPIPGGANFSSSLLQVLPIIGGFVGGIAALFSERLR